MNKATRILENMIPDDRKTMTAALGEIPENADPDSQAQYINDLLNYAEANDIPMQNVMQKCGGSCLTKEVIELAKDIYEKSSSVEQFFSSLNDIGIGGGNTKITPVILSMFRRMVLPFVFRGVRETSLGKNGGHHYKWGKRVHL